MNEDLHDQIDKLQKQLEIALESLKLIEEGKASEPWDEARCALRQIEAINAKN